MICDSRELGKVWAWPVTQYQEWVQVGLSGCSVWHLFKRQGWHHTLGYIPGHTLLLPHLPWSQS